MTRKILGLILAALLPVAAFGQTNVIQNEAGTSYAPNAGNINSNVAVDRALRLLVSVSSGQPSATNPVKLEDSVATTGDAGIAALGVINDTFATLAANGDYVFHATGRAGNGLSTLVIDDILPMSRQVAKFEDVATTTGDPAVPVLVKLQSAISADAAAEDYGLAKGDTGGRLITASSPSGEIVAGCNAAIVTATTGTIIGATASKFTFVTSLSCTNTGAAATRVILEDGAGTDLANVMLPATTGFATVSFPTPVKTSVVNSVIQANVITTSSSTICCASGFVGVI